MKPSGDPSLDPNSDSPPSTVAGSERYGYEGPEGIFIFFEDDRIPRDDEEFWSAFSPLWDFSDDSETVLPAPGAGTAEADPVPVEPSANPQSASNKRAF